MRHARESKWRGIFFSGLFLCGILAALGFMTLAFARAYYKNYEVERYIADLKKNKEKLESKKIETLEVLNYIKSSDFIEQKARTELNMVKKGESKLIITDSSVTSTGQPMKDMIQQNSTTSNIQKWWHYFFH